jgi:hypothetical protein
MVAVSSEVQAQLKSDYSQVYKDTPVPHLSFELSPKYDHVIHEFLAQHYVRRATVTLMRLLRIIPWNDQQRRAATSRGIVRKYQFTIHDVAATGGNPDQRDPEQTGYYGTDIDDDCELIDELMDKRDLTCLMYDNAPENDMWKNACDIWAPILLGTNLVEESGICKKMKVTLQRDSFLSYGAETRPGAPDTSTATYSWLVANDGNFSDYQPRLTAWVLLDADIDVYFQIKNQDGVISNTRMSGIGTGIVYAPRTTNQFMYRYYASTFDLVFDTDYKNEEIPPALVASATWAKVDFF